MGARFDAVIAGGGMAGLSLAIRLLEQCPGLRLAVVDREHADHPHKHWSYWSDDPAGELPASVAARIPLPTWRRMQVAGPGFARTRSLGDLAYATVSSRRFEHEARAQLVEHPDVTLCEDEIGDFEADAAGCTVVGARRRLRGDFVFQSCRMPRDLRARVRSPVLQHFGGWVVHTERPVFDASSFTMMDFDVAQRDGPTFMYRLPFGPDRALLETTTFSARPSAHADYDAALREELTGRWGLAPSEVTIERREYGVIPMFDRGLVQRPHPRLFSIGVAGGMAKPTTGFAFVRTQRQTAHLADTWRAHGRPSALPAPARRFAFYDALLLDLIHRRPGVATHVFHRLLASADVEAMLRFLDEGSSLREEAAIFARLPWGPFLRAVPRGLITRAAPPLSALEPAASR